MGSALFGSTAQFSDVLEFGHFTAARTKTPQADSTCAANFAAYNRRHENRSAALIYIKLRMGNALHNLLPDIEDPEDCTSASKHLQWRRDFNERSGHHLMSPFALSGRADASVSVIGGLRRLLEQGRPRPALVTGSTGPQGHIRIFDGRSHPAPRSAG